MESVAIKIGIIGGTGLAETNIVQNARELQVKTPFGYPSDILIDGEIEGIPVIFLSRHGRKHDLSPTMVNYRANIWAMKKSGASIILATSACGSLREHVEPGHMVVVDSFIDRTTKREQSFHDGKEGHPAGVCHIPMEPSFNEKMRSVIISTLQKLRYPHHTEGTIVCIEGPRFSTLAESKMYRDHFKASLVGMTVCPEAVLSKEMGIPYALIGLVTDYDCWNETSDKVSVQAVMELMKDMSEKARKLILHVIREIFTSNDEFVLEIEQTENIARNAVMNSNPSAFDHPSFDYIS